MGALYRCASIDPVIVQPLASVNAAILSRSVPNADWIWRSQISCRPPEECGCTQDISRQERCGARRGTSMVNGDKSGLCAE